MHELSILMAGVTGSGVDKTGTLIAIGTFYQIERRTFEENYPRLIPLQPARKVTVEEAAARFF